MNGAEYRTILKAQRKKLRIDQKDVEDMTRDELLNAVYVCHHALTMVRRESAGEDTIAKMLDVFFNGRPA